MEKTIDEEQLADAIRDRIPTDRYLSYMVGPLGVSLHRLIACANRHGIKYPNKHATDEQIGDAVHAVTIRGLSIRDAANDVGISRAAVQRYVAKRRNAYVASNFDFQPMRVKPYRCPRHGLVSISPCIACESLASGKK